MCIVVVNIGITVKAVHSIVYSVVANITVVTIIVIRIIVGIDIAAGVLKVV